MAPRCDLAIHRHVPMERVIIATRHDGRLSHASRLARTLLNRLWDLEFRWPGTVLDYLAGATPDWFPRQVQRDRFPERIAEVKAWLEDLLTDPGLS